MRIYYNLNRVLDIEIDDLSIIIIIGKWESTIKIRFTCANYHDLDRFLKDVNEKKFICIDDYEQKNEESK